jgi:hypothetical protein
VLVGQVDNLVGPNLPAFREIYKGSLERMKSESLLDNITDADTISQARAISLALVDFVLSVLVSQNTSAQSRQKLFHMLPKQVQDKFAVSTASTAPNSAEVTRVLQGIVSRYLILSHLLDRP